MLALGLNGWTDGTHDGAAALVRDGVVLAFVEQERLSRRKHAVGEFPHQAVQSVLNIGGVDPAEINVISYGWDLPRYYSSRSRSLNVEDATERLTGFSAVRRHQRITWVRHHDAHAAAAYHGSGFGEAAVVIADAEGEEESISIYSASSEGLRPLRRFGRASSLGLLYRAASAFCGFGQEGAGKTMGLSAYGTAARDLVPLALLDDEFRSPFTDQMSEREVIDGWLQILERAFGSPFTDSERSRSGFLDASAHRPHVAASVQQTLVDVMTEVVALAVRLTGSRNVCLAGGVALNCLANASLLMNKELALNGLFVPPYPHDAGVALGSALVATGQYDAGASVRADLGPVVDASNLPTSAKRLGLPWSEIESPAELAAELVSAGKIIGWVQGNMEVGPRALGNRSILASPAKPSTRDRVNRLKRREAWRPLAPSVLEREVPRLFASDCRSPYMLLSPLVSAQAAELIPGAVHANGTARLQTVKTDSGPYSALLERMAEITGVGAVLNTSFNGRGEPIVCTVEEALVSAATLKLDAVIADRFIVTIGQD